MLEAECYNKTAWVPTQNDNARAEAKAGWNGKGGQYKKKMTEEKSFGSAGIE